MPKSDQAFRARAVALFAEDLCLAEIGRRLSTSKQRVQ
jgi:hypothetical protein